MQAAFPVCFHGQIELIVGSFWGIRLMQSPERISRGLPSTGNNSGNSSQLLQAECGTICLIYLFISSFKVQREPNRWSLLNPNEAPSSHSAWYRQNYLSSQLG